MATHSNAARSKACIKERRHQQYSLTSDLEQSGRHTVTEAQLPASSQLHRAIAWILPLFHAAIWSYGIVLAVLLGSDSESSSLHQANMVACTFLPGTIVAFVAPSVVSSICNFSDRRWLRVLCYIAVLGCSVAFSCFLSLQIPVLLARYVIATMNLLFHMKLNELMVYLADGHTATNELGCTTPHAMTLRNSGAMYRAAFVIFGVNILDVDFIDHTARWRKVYGPAILDFTLLACHVSVCLLLLGFLQYDLGVDIPPVLLAYVEMLSTYPLLCCLVWMTVIPHFVLSGGFLPRQRSGTFPYASSSLLEFWGKRYNHLISDLCRRSVLQPLVVHHGLSPSAASFVVFTVTGLLHAVPIALLPHSRTWHVAGQMCFFWSQWGVCAAERRFRWRRSNIRTLAIFVALFPLFGITTIDACVLHPDMRISPFFSRRAWDWLHYILGTRGALAGLRSSLAWLAVDSDARSI